MCLAQIICDAVSGPESIVVAGTSYPREQKGSAKDTRFWEVGLRLFHFSEAAGDPVFCYWFSLASLRKVIAGLAQALWKVTTADIETQSRRLIDSAFSY